MRFIKSYLEGYRRAVKDIRSGTFMAFHEMPDEWFRSGYRKSSVKYLPDSDNMVAYQEVF